MDLTDVTDDPEGPLAAMVADYYRSIHSARGKEQNK